MTTSRSIPALIAAALVLTASGTAWAVNPYQVQSGYESYLKGQADVGKAQAAIVVAQANVISTTAQTGAVVAKAQDDMQKVVSMSLDNDLKAAKAYFEKKRMYAQYRTEQVGKGKRTAPATQPRRASDYQVSSVSGRIAWPPVFQQEAFAEERGEIDRLFTLRRQQASGLGSNFCRQVKAATADMREDLKELVDDLTPAEYLSARRFLDHVALEAEMTPRAEGVAVAR